MKLNFLSRYTIWFEDKYLNIDKTEYCHPNQTTVFLFTCALSVNGIYSALYNKPLLLIIKRTLRYTNFNYKPPVVCQEETTQNTQEI